MEPILTIGFPVYNRRVFLKPALQSIFAQTFQEWQLIIVDDGSEDGSAEFISRLRDPRVRLLERGPKRGLAARLNQIVQAARTPYFARMDADDMLDDTRLEKQVNYLRAHPEVDVVGCGLVILDRRGRPTGLRLFGIDHASICANPLQGIRLSDATVVGETEWFRKHPYNEENRSCQDFELWFSSYRTGNFANLLEPLYYYREFTAFSISTYIDAKHRAGRLRWRQRADFGLLRTSGVCLLQYVQTRVNQLAFMIGLRNYPMIRRRSKPIDDDTRAHVLLTTERILNTPLPLMRTSASDSAQLVCSSGSAFTGR